MSLIGASFIIVPKIPNGLLSLAVSLYAGKSTGPYHRVPHTNQLDKFHRVQMFMYKVVISSCHSRGMAEWL